MNLNTIKIHRTIINICIEPDGVAINGTSEKTVLAAGTQSIRKKIITIANNNKRAVENETNKMDLKRDISTSSISMFIIK